MKIGTVSPELLLRLAMIAGGIGLAWYVYRQVMAGAGAAAQTARDIVAAAEDVADSVIVGTNPANPDNWVNRGVSAVGGAIVSDTGPGRNADGSWTLGGAIFDLLHPGWASAASGPVKLSALQSPDEWGSEGRRGTPPVFNAATEEITNGWDTPGSYAAP